MLHQTLLFLHWKGQCHFGSVDLPKHFAKCKIFCSVSIGVLEPRSTNSLVNHTKKNKPTPEFTLTLFQVSEYINRTFATFWNLFLRTVWTVGVIQLRSNFLFYIFASTQRSSLMFLVALNWLLFTWIFSSGTALEVP